MTQTIPILYNEKTGKKYKILGAKKDDSGSTLLKLQGKTASWWEPFAPELWQRLGYKQIKETTDEAE